MSLHPAPAVAGRDLRRAAPVLLGLAVLATAVHLWGLYRVTGPPSPPWFPYADKVQHLLGFALPVFLIGSAAIAWGQRRGRVMSRWVLVVIAALFAVHAVVSEIIQHLAYATRSGDPYDALADLVGVGLGLLAVMRLTRPAEGRPR